jgi:hypothetical protein
MQLRAASYAIAWLVRHDGLFAVVTWVQSVPSYSHVSATPFDPLNRTMRPRLASYAIAEFARGDGLVLVTTVDRSSDLKTLVEALPATVRERE